MEKISRWVKGGPPLHIRTPAITNMMHIHVMYIVVKVICVHRAWCAMGVPWQVFRLGFELRKCSRMRTRLVARGHKPNKAQTLHDGA